MLTAKLRPKKCKQCGNEYVPFKSFQKTCLETECLVKQGRELADKRKLQAQKAERRDDREKKQKLKTRQQWLKEVQSLVNKAVRLRDAQRGCISCDRSANWDGQWHASHYKSVGANSALRFNLNNIHKSCSVCNNYLSGNIGEYRPRLIERIGLGKVLWLDSHERVRSYTIPELERMKIVFTKLCKRYERRTA